MSDGGVVVAIPTFHRREALEKLLSALAPQVSAAGAAVLVVDNDPEGSARDVAAAHGVDYVVEPGRGLAAVRNRALDLSSAARALVFIDDDEVPGEGWLDALLDRWRTTGAAAVSGRVETRFPDGFDDPWIDGGGFFRRVRFPDGTRQPVAPTNNLLLDLDAVRGHALRFDERFGLSGGEDILFTKQLVRAGGVILSCPDALVFDVVAPERLTRKWVLRRAYRVGVSTVRTDIAVDDRFRVRAKGFLNGVARAGLGTARWVVGTLIRSPRHSARGARAAWRGAGMLAAAFGADYQEYAKR